VGSNDLSLKEASYYANTREDLVALLERPLGSVLDVGCGAGGVGPGLRRAGATRLVGIELDPDAAEHARAFYDRVEVGSADEVANALDEPFDTILCFDVLEHLADPGKLLVDLLARAAPGARLAVSVPNVRHYSTFANLLLRGTFGYCEEGIHDVTHLRWFTRRDMVRELEDAGWRVGRTAHSPLDRFRRVMTLSPRRLGEFLVHQWYFFASRTDAAR
jgi:2-polyprenyl-3-methyl-5-hydroxy-6-metoxy-1,4-benzoquinol methylase